MVNLGFDLITAMIAIGVMVGFWIAYQEVMKITGKY